MATTNVPRFLEFQDMKVFKAPTPGGTTKATVTFNANARFAVLVVTHRPTTNMTYCGAYLVFGYTSNNAVATKSIAPIVAASQVTIGAETSGFNVTAGTANIGVSIIVLWDSTDSASVTFA